MDHPTHSNHRPRQGQISAPFPTTATGVKYKQPPELPLPPPPVPRPPPVGLTSPPLPAIPPSSPDPVASPAPRPSPPAPRSKKAYTFAPVLPPLPGVGGSPFAFGDVNGDGNGNGHALPRRPSTASALTHQRRPSRAERYEALVDSARELVRKDNGAELGSSGFGKRREEQAEVIRTEDWKYSVMDLLKVVDGMARQLATHDELAAQLKIAQSNLTLAETHTDYLEETIRRRGSIATTIGRRLSNSSTLHGLGMGSTVDGIAAANPDTAASKVTAFFRPKLARKNTTGATGRATSISPHVGQPPGSPEPRTSSSSSDMPEWTQLEARNASLEAANAALSHEREELAKKCAALEKTKDDLLVELEGVTAELFQEANMMVSDERKKVARFQEEADALRGEVARLHEELAALRAMPPPSLPSASRTPTLVHTSPRNVRNLTISPPPSAQPHSPPMKPVPGSSSSAMLRSNSLDPSSAARLPLTLDTNASRAPPSPTSPHPPASPAESATSTTRKWFQFGRGGSATSPAPGEGEDVRLEAPGMERGDSVQSNATTSSLASIANSLFGGGVVSLAEPQSTETHALDSTGLNGLADPSDGPLADRVVVQDPIREPEAEPEPIPTPPTAVPEAHKTRFPRSRSRSRSPPPRSPGGRQRPPPVPLLPPSPPHQHAVSAPPAALPAQRPQQKRTVSLGQSPSSSRAYPPLPLSPAVAGSPGSQSSVGRGPMYSSPLPIHAFDRANSGGSAGSGPARSSPRLVVQMPDQVAGTSPRQLGLTSQPPTPGLGIPPSPLTASRPGSRAGSVKAMDDLDSLMDSIQGMTEDLFGGQGGGHEDETEELEGVAAGVEVGAGSGSGQSSVGRSEPASEPASEGTEEEEEEDGEEEEDLEGAEVVVGTRVAEGARRGSGESGGVAPAEE